MNTMMTMMQNMMEGIKDVKKEQERYENEIKELRNEKAEIKTELAQLKNTVERKRKYNLVLSGLEIGSEDGKVLKEITKNFIREHLEVDANLKQPIKLVHSNV